METFLIIIVIIGIVEAVIFIVGIIYAIYLWFRGILPVLFRLGSGLAKRKIAIFAKGDNLISLKILLMDSRLFKEKNISRCFQKMAKYNSIHGLRRRNEKTAR